MSGSATRGPLVIEGSLAAGHSVVAHSEFSAERWRVAEEAVPSGYAVAYIEGTSLGVGYADYAAGNLRWIQVPARLAWAPVVSPDHDRIEMAGQFVELAVSEDSVHVLVASEKLFVGAIDRESGAWRASRTFESLVDVRWATRTGAGWNLLRPDQPGNHTGLISFGWMPDGSSTPPTFDQLAAEPGAFVYDTVRVVRGDDGERMLLSAFGARDEPDDLVGYVWDPGKLQWRGVELRVPTSLPSTSVFVAQDGWVLMDTAIRSPVVARVQGGIGDARAVPELANSVPPLVLSGGRILPRARDGGFWASHNDKTGGRPWSPPPELTYSVDDQELHPIVPLPAPEGTRGHWTPRLRVDLAGRVCLFGGSASAPTRGAISVIGGICLDPRTLDWDWVETDFDGAQCRAIASFDRRAVVRCGERRWDEEFVGDVGVSRTPSTERWRVELVELR